MNGNYYIAQAKPQQEFKAQRDLNRLGYDTVMPLETKFIRPRGKRPGREITRPLMPGYVAFGGQYMDFPAIWGLKSLTGLLGIAGEPVQISEEVVDYIRHMEALPVAERAPFKKGDRVTIINSPWSTGVVVIDSIKGANATIVLQAFGGERRVGVKIKQLEAA